MFRVHSQAAFVDILCSKGEYSDNVSGNDSMTKFRIATYGGGGGH
jgi:hypothetical protein